MSSPAPLILIPSVCWILGVVAIRNMDKTRKNWLFALSLICAVLLMIALLLFRLFVRYTAFRMPRNALWFGVTILLFCGVGIFWRAWSLYNRDALAAEEIGPYCKAGFLMIGGAGLSCLIAYLGAA